MSDLSKAPLEDADWLDTEVSDAEAASEMHDQQDSLKRKRSLVLTAVGLSVSASDARERLRAGLVIRRNPFTHLPKDIRNQVYEYFACFLQEGRYMLDDWNDACNLQLTCRQAKQEWDAERHRRFWIYLEKNEEPLPLRNRI